MTRTVNTEIAGRFHDLADTLVHNATVLSTAGLPETVTAVRATVYGDVAAQLRLLADVEFDQAEGNPLVIAVAEDEITAAVTRRFGLLAGQLAANARILTARTADAVMARRAAVYRDVAAQVRLLADEAALSVTARRRQVSRPPLSNIAPVTPIAAKAASRAPRVRAEFLESLVDAIARRRRAGWSVARLTLWLRTSLRDPQTDAVHPCAQRSFVTYVTSLLAGPQALHAA
ncbi:hypothetical protein OG439_32545 [Amycolatopsis sp. NBC_01307]|uniref:hypothetical protein n=1 Tax=Amycolatopsis sp. NBC_01307 TaxID=2903561 RepID=UPI002E10D592|nr:hypothetical protein OG439_32545 [Amycolatopsis sp. NBC_01307]